MKTIVIIKLCVCVVFLLTIVLDGVRTESVTERLNKMAKKGGKIDGIFKPARNGSLDQYTDIYRGQFIPLDIEVAMKFRLLENSNYSRNEYEMYTYLNAISNSSDKAEAENFGIPTIYYYGKWDKYTMLAMTLLRSTSQQEIVRMTERDIFIAFREFVRTIKYIHSKGVRRVGMDIKNMIFRNDQGFIFGFGIAKDMSGGTLAEKAWGVQYDFDCFLHSLTILNYNWQHFGFNEEEASKLKDYFTFRDNTGKVANYNEVRGFDGLRSVFVEFRKYPKGSAQMSVEAANGTLIPFYDHLYGFIVAEMKNRGVEATPSNPPISDIADPFEEKEWSRSPVDYEFLEKLYAGAKEKKHEASTSGGLFSKLFGKRPQT